MKSFVIRPLRLLLGILLLLQATARAEEAGPNITDIFITTSQTHLLLFCSIKNGFTQEMIEGVKNGIPITFTFLIELERTVKSWPDSTLAEMTIQHTLTYDTLKEQYQVTLPERSSGMVVTESLDKAIRYICRQGMHANGWRPFPYCNDRYGEFQDGGAELTAAFYLEVLDRHCRRLEAGGK